MLKLIHIQMSGIILGIANLDERSHDNAACLIKKGRLVAQAEEERFTREKHAYDSMPTKAISFCLDRANVKGEDLDTISVGWNLPDTLFDNVSTPIDCSRERILKALFPEDDLTNSNVDIQFIPHHLAHAASVYYSSGFKDAAILVIDGAGELDATSLWKGNGKDLQLIKTWSYDPHSLGFMFEGVSQYLGFRGSDAGKVMGLAAYHQDKVPPFPNVNFNDGYNITFTDFFKKSVLESARKKLHYWLMDIVVDYWTKYCEELFGPREKMLALDNNIVHPQKAQVAARLQETLERVVLSLAKYAKELTGSKNLCLTGGVALNCSANGFLEKQAMFESLYINPAAGDSGVALGSALFTHYNLDNQPALSNLSELSQSPFWGPEFSDSEIKAFLESLAISFKECDDDYKNVAELIERGQIIAWFQGAMEIGPRALGARSILADPRNPNNLAKVNKIKEREPWRPLAPSILHGYEAEFFTPAICSPFMLKAATVLGNRRSRIPAVVHTDGSSRYQSVLKEFNPRYWQLIEGFRKLTGIPLVLNTSFNHHEPIVCTPKDAYRTFQNRAIDHLVMGKYIINK
ncbi:MAG: carbamoyltransferase C-terminal domain-containing protein [Candidatus Gracilibacteria bacterium]|nr:carbamoyltransferase C-terminal domain-containing protein [Candidatus Gracilibacteria bacterium]